MPKAITPPLAPSAREICKAYGFTVEESKVIPGGFVAKHPKGWKVAWSPDGAYIIYGQSRRNGSSEGNGERELFAALSRNRVLFEGIDARKEITR